jgi:hypothetical protein
MLILYCSAASTKFLCLWLKGFDFLKPKMYKEEKQGRKRVRKGGR